MGKSTINGHFQTDMLVYQGLPQWKISQKMGMTSWLHISSGVQMQVRIAFSMFLPWLSHVIPTAGWHPETLGMSWSSIGQASKNFICGHLPGKLYLGRLNAPGDHRKMRRLYVCDAAHLWTATPLFTPAAVKRPHTIVSHLPQCVGRGGCVVLLSVGPCTFVNWTIQGIFR